MHQRIFVCLFVLAKTMSRMDLLYNWSKNRNLSRIRIKWPFYDGKLHYTLMHMQLSSDAAILNPPIWNAFICDCGSGSDEAEQSAFRQNTYLFSMHFLSKQQNAQERHSSNDRHITAVWPKSEPSMTLQTVLVFHKSQLKFHKSPGTNGIWFYWLKYSCLGLGAF